MTTYRSKHCSGMIAVLAPFGDGHRLMKFRDDGPSGHVQFEDVERMERELEREWVEDESAGADLDRWAATEKWARGLKSCAFLDAWNYFSFHQRGDLCRQLDAVATEHGIDAALEFAQQHRGTL